MEVLAEFIKVIGPSDNPYTLPSRRRLLKHLRAREAEAAVAEMRKFLQRLQAHYLERWNSRAPGDDSNAAPATRARTKARQ